MDTYSVSNDFSNSIHPKEVCYFSFRLYHLLGGCNAYVTFYITCCFFVTAVETVRCGAVNVVCVFYIIIDGLFVGVVCSGVFTVVESFRGFGCAICASVFAITTICCRFIKSGGFMYRGG